MDAIPKDILQQIRTDTTLPKVTPEVRLEFAGLDDIDVDVLPVLRDRYFTALDAHKQAEWDLSECRSLLLDAIGTGRRAKCLGDLVATRTVRDGCTFSLQPARKRSTAA